MSTVVLKRAEQILQALINKIVARTDLSDITDTSSMKHLLAGFARELDEAYFQLGLVQNRFSIAKAEGDDLDERATEIQPSLIARRLATKANGAVVFSRSGTVGTITIPVGTSVKTASGVTFTTTVVGTILNGFSSSNSVSVVAATAGASGNVAAATVVKFDSKPVGVDSVTNPSSFGQTGENKETDDEFRARIKAFIRSLPRNTPEALEFIAREVSITNGEHVVYSHVFEDPINRGEVTLFIDNGSGTTETVLGVVGEVVTEGLAGPPPDSAVGGEEFLDLDNKPVKTLAAFVLTSSGGPGRGLLVSGTDYVLNDATGQIYFTPPLLAGEIITADYTAFTGLIAAVQKVIDGDPLDRINFPGWRAAGVRVRVQTPTILQQVVAAVLVIKDGFTDADVPTAVKDAVASYINGLGISGDVLHEGVAHAIMGVPGVYNVTLVQPAADVIINDDELPRITAGDILLS